VKGATLFVVSAVVGWIAWHASASLTKLGRARTDLVAARTMARDRRKVIRQLLSGLLFVGACVLVAAMLFAVMTPP